ncbi:MAG: prepilin-type N-terminal cleavage/methylation domain-containing protein [Myxococcota bacterium]
MKQRTEGMTLIEVMIVVIIMALIATAVGMAVMPQIINARIKTATTEAAAVRHAATVYAVEYGGCPTLDDLVGDYLDPHTRHEDPWGNPYAIVCEDGDYLGLSAGPDGVFDTDDDIPDPTGDQSRSR